MERISRVVEDDVDEVIADVALFVDAQRVHFEVGRHHRENVEYYLDSSVAPTNSKLAVHVHRCVEALGIEFGLLEADSLVLSKSKNE